jgi:hypothetical protein
VPDQKTTIAATSSHANDPNWYLDSGATGHITGELDKLTMHDHYHGGDWIRAANNAGMTISHIGTFVIPTTYHTLHLKNVFHVPHTHKHLIILILTIIPLLSFIDIVSLLRTKQ